jgi:adenylyltransferase/sulfurtransferase
LVKIIFPSIITKVTNGEKETQVSASTVEDALNQLTLKYGDSFKNRIFDVSGNPKRFLNLYVNGKNIRFLNNLATPVTDDDEMTILPSITGG